MSISYGGPPIDMGTVDLSPEEMMCYLYLPVKMARSREFRLPERLNYLRPMLARVRNDVRYREDYLDLYIYVTAKTLFVQGDYSGNRPGWHADGFGSGGDLNYLWYNMNPTEFAVQDFHNIPTDDMESIQECGHLLRFRFLITSSILREIHIIICSITIGRCMVAGKLVILIAITKILSKSNKGTYNGN